MNETLGSMAGRTAFLSAWAVIAMLVVPPRAVAQGGEAIVLGDTTLAATVANELRAVQLRPRTPPDNPSLVHVLFETQGTVVVLCRPNALHVWLRSRDPVAPDAAVPIEGDPVSAAVRVAELAHAAFLDPVPPPPEKSNPPVERADQLHAPHTSVSNPEPPPTRERRPPNKPGRSPDAGQTTDSSETERVSSTFELGGDLWLSNGEIGPVGSIVAGASVRVWDLFYARGRFAYQVNGPTVASSELPETEAEVRLTRMSIEAGWRHRFKPTPFSVSAGVGGAAVHVAARGRPLLFPELRESNAHTWIGWPFATAGVHVALHDHLAAFTDLSVAYAPTDVVVALPSDPSLLDNTDLGSLGSVSAQFSLGLEAKWAY